MKKFIFEIDGFGYNYFDDYMDDNIKRFHELHVPGKERSESIDFSPYGRMTEETFANIVEFYKKNGRAPDRFADVDNTNNVYCPMTDTEIAAAVHRPVKPVSDHPFRRQ